MIDIHCHILPKVDDGAENIKETMEMIEMSMKDGTRDIIVTPHFMEGRFEVPFQEIKKLVREINKKIQKKELGVRLYPGQEIMLNYNTLKDYKDGLIGGLNDSKFLLIELKCGKFDKGLMDVIYELTLMGVRPIIAHPERYRFIIEDVENINMFIEEGCLFQLNIGSISGKFGKKIKGCAKTLLDNGVYDFIGSDAHGSDTRVPELKSTILKQKNKRKNQMVKLIKNNENLLGDTFIPSKKENLRRESLFEKLFRF